MVFRLLIMKKTNISDTKNVAQFQRIFTLRDIPSTSSRWKRSWGHSGTERGRREWRPRGWQQWGGDNVAKRNCKTCLGEIAFDYVQLLHLRPQIFLFNLAFAILFSDKRSDIKNNRKFVCTFKAKRQWDTLLKRRESLLKAKNNNLIKYTTYFCQC